MNERTQKDIDIARMSSLKSAIELMTAFKDKIEVDADGIIPVATGIADSLLSWIYSGNVTASYHVDTKTSEVLDKPAGPQQQKPKPDVQQGNGVEAGRTHASHSHGLPDWLKSMVEALKEDFIMFKEIEEEEINQSGGFNDGGWLERSRETFGNQPGDPYPISQKQYGFLVGLFKRIGVTPNGHKRFLTSLSSQGASELIDFIQQQLPSGKDTLNKLKNDLKERQAQGRRINE